MKLPQYWHEMSLRKQKVVFEACKISGMKVGEFKEKFKQPPWCGYPEALEGIMGCWSLIYCYIDNEDYCKNCDSHIIRAEDSCQNQ